MSFTEEGSPPAIQTDNNQTMQVCDKACEYDSWFRRAYCNARGLNEVPYPSGCESSLTLELQDNNIMVLVYENLAGYKRVRTLDISDNVILKLEPGTFSGMSELRNLVLNGNQLINVSNGTFRGTESSLERLFLNNNRIRSLDEGAFTGLIKLRALYLNDNEINVLPIIVFDDLHMLELLALDTNKIRYVNNTILHGLTMLRWVSLSRNDLEQIPNEFFLGLTSLSEVIFSFNNLAAISTPANLCIGQKLTLLDLRNNAINDSDYILPYLSISVELRLDGNPFVCNCGFRLLQDWYRNKSVVEYLDSPLQCTFNGTLVHITSQLPVNCQIETYNTPDVAVTPAPTTEIRIPTSEADHVTTRAMHFISTENSITTESFQRHVMPTLTFAVLLLFFILWLFKSSVSIIMWCKRKCQCDASTNFQCCRN